MNGGGGRKRGAALLRWLGQVTDASLLRVPRFFGFLYGPIDDRLPLGDAWHKALRYRLPAHAGWAHALGGITFFLFLILIVTGVLLSFYYRPSVEEAYPSVQYIESQVTFGWLVRNVHHWAANLVVIAVALHLLRTLLAAAYKHPRETNWLVGLLLLLVLLLFGLTGYLLPWDQWAYWTTTHALDVLKRLPLVGGPLVRVLQGDEFVTGATLSRFFALHVIVLPWLALGLLGLHFQLVRKHGIAPPPGREIEPGAVGEPYYPNHVLRQLIAVFLVIGIVVTLAALYPRPLSRPADPFTPSETLPTLWYPAALLRAATYYLGGWGLALLVILGVLLALLPLLDRSSERRLLRRPLVTGATALVVLMLAGLWIAGQRLTEPVAGGHARVPEATVVPQPGAEPAPAGPQRPQPQPPTGPGRMEQIPEARP